MRVTAVVLRRRRLLAVATAGCRLRLGTLTLPGRVSPLGDVRRRGDGPWYGATDASLAHVNALYWIRARSHPVDARWGPSAGTALTRLVRPLRWLGIEAGIAGVVVAIGNIERRDPLHDGGHAVLGCSGKEIGGSRACGGERQPGGQRGHMSQPSPGRACPLGGDLAN